ncbi:MAG TPA: YitT family protein, partial [Anaerolineae bacterium]|nr:YitT family protein [Anaerolineae bacterium]
MRTLISRQRLWPAAQDYFLVTVGALLLAVNMNLFLAPANIAPGGVSGTAIIINHLTGWPIGLTMLVLNVPLVVLGFLYLGRFRFLTRTVYAVLLYTLGVDLLALWLPAGGLTDDVLLNALYGGVVAGLATGMVYRGGGTTAGTGTLSRVFQIKTGLPISQLYVLVDGGVILAAGLVFGWEQALYALITLFVWGIAA